MYTKQSSLIESVESDVFSLQRSYNNSNNNNNPRCLEPIQPNTQKIEFRFMFKMF